MKLSISLIILCLIAINNNVLAQRGNVIDGTPKDSVVIDFSINDPVIKDTNKFYIQRSAKDSLWQIGTTQKTFFSAGGFAKEGIMTDSVNTYPINADCSFVLNLPQIYKYKAPFNPIVTFTHRYETDSANDGGLVEFSVDSGATWNNVRGDCSVDSGMLNVGILLDNFYKDYDTLSNGTPSFYGTSNGWITSRVQFFVGFPVRTTGTGGPNCVPYHLMLRFRFISDSTADTLDGWIVDNIKVEEDDYGSNINDMKNLGALSIYPNPAYDQVILPDLPQQDEYTIELYNMIGEKIVDQNYQHRLDVKSLNRGLYLYRVSNGTYLYSGKLQLE